MTITIEQLYGRKTKRTVGSTGKIVRTHHAKYRLASTASISSAEASAEFSAQTGITEFTPLTEDPFAFCRGIDVADEMTRDPWKFLVDVDWSTEVPDPNQPNRENDDPFADQAEIECDDELVTLPLFKDRDDKMIANTVGDRIAGVEEEKSIEIVVITRNEPRRDSARDRQFRNRVNQNAFSGGAPGTVKIRSIKSSRQFRNRIEFWKYRYELAYKADGWQPNLLNAGLYKLDVDDERVPCLDRYNEPVTEAVPLDDNSEQIAPEDLPDDAHFLDFESLDEADFDQLGLPV